MTTLFPDRSELQTPGQGHSPLLASFKAGILKHEASGDGSFVVTADPRRGRCTIERNDNGTRVFKWFPRDAADTSGKLEFLLSPGEQAFSRVDTGIETDRVFLLQSNVVPSRRFFFWLQEIIEAEKDVDLVNKVNKLCGNNVALSELDLFLQSMGFDPEDQNKTDTTAAVPDAGPQRPGPQPVLVPLTAVLSHEKVRELIESEEAQRELLPLLPEGAQTVEELRATLTSPQFNTALRRLSGACMSGQYNDIMSNFGLDPQDGALQFMQGNNIGAVVAALIAKGKREQEAAEAAAEADSNADAHENGDDNADAGTNSQ